VLEHRDFALGDAAAIDHHVDRFADPPVERHRRALLQRHQLGHRHFGAAEHDLHVDRDVHDDAVVADVPGDRVKARRWRRSTFLMQHAAQFLYGAVELLLLDVAIRFRIRLRHIPSPIRPRFQPGRSPSMNSCAASKGCFTRTV
jgi:hypothetical protein